MKMQNTEMEFVAFDAQDVIATSGNRTVTFANFFDKNNFDETVIGDDGVTSFYDSNKQVLNLEAMSDYYGVEIRYETPVRSGDKEETLAELLRYCGFIPNEEKEAAFNGVFEWLDGVFVRVNQ